MKVARAAALCVSVLMLAGCYGSKTTLPMAPGGAPQASDGSHSKPQAEANVTSAVATAPPIIGGGGVDKSRLPVGSDVLRWATFRWRGKYA